MKLRKAAARPQSSAKASIAADQLLGDRRAGLRIAPWSEGFE
jgi:hypothetical protein